MSKIQTLASGPARFHYQDNDGNKYLYDVKEKTFAGGPRKVKLLMEREEFKKAIAKGLKLLGEAGES